MLFRKKMDETPNTNPESQEQTTETPEETVETTVVETPVEEIPEPTEPAGVICGKCNGTGLLNPSLMCDECEGSGRI